jgi:phosphoribosyl 1,2-cyclic phosphate phosphodiesterase
MRFRFLGTGTSSGVPAIGCGCDVCRSDDPRDRRLRTSGVIEFTDASGQERVILIDAGPDLREQSLRAVLRRLDAILFTHNHVDHTWGLDEVRRFNAVMKSPIDVYADERTMGFLRRVYAHIFDKTNNLNDSFVATLVPRVIEPTRTFSLYGVRVTPIPLLHGKLPVLGYRFERSGGEGGGSVFPLAYCTDVSGIPPESWALLDGLGTLVLDALRLRHHPTHFNLEQAVGVAQRVGAGKTWFIHVAHEMGHAETNAELPEGMALAHDGQVLE